MSRRSPLNKRYQKDSSPSGTTRRSAASAKPKRTLSDSASSKTTVKPAGKTVSKPRREPIVINPPTPEFRAWRKRWWILLITATVLTALSFVLRTRMQWFPASIPAKTYLTLASVALGLGYVGIFGALFIDMTKMRPLRQAYAEQLKHGGSKKSNKAEKAEKTDKADKAVVAE